MKRTILFLFFWGIISLSYSQTSVTEIFISEQGGTVIQDGTSFDNAYKQQDFIDKVTLDSLYKGDLILYLAKGNYTNFNFLNWTSKFGIHSVSIYGGFDGTEILVSLKDRDLINNRTIIDQNDLSYPAVWYEVVNGGCINIIDGVTIRASSSLQGSAIRMVQTPFYYSKCRIEKSDAPYGTLIFLEANMDMESSFINCVISQNDVNQIFETLTSINLVNSVVADNSSMTLFNVNDINHEIISVYNTILWGNKNIYCENDYPVNVGHSIVQDFNDCKYIIDLGGNINKDPDFEYGSNDPYRPYIYSCAIGSGKTDYINCYNGVNERDIINENRDYCNTIDIGAYQYGCCNSFANNSNKKVKEEKNTINQEERKRSLAALYYSKYSQQLYLTINSEEVVKAQLYNTTGQLIYETNCTLGRNALPINLPAGVYLCSYMNNKNEVIYTEKLISQ